MGLQQAGGVLSGSVLGLVLSNVLINDLDAGLECILSLQVILNEDLLTPSRVERL